MNGHQEPSELDWLAFCYAAGELNAADAESFETRLADDQAAREALAGAIELTQVLAAAEAQSGNAEPGTLVQPAAAMQNQWQSRLSWMVVGGLASVLLFLGITSAPSVQLGKKFSASKQQLASAWNETRSHLAQVDDLDVVPAFSDVDDDSAASIAMSDLDEDEAPSWLMAAVMVAGERSNQRLEN